MEVKYGHGSVCVLKMPSQSCAQTALEILTGNPDLVEPTYQLDADGKES